MSECLLELRGVTMRFGGLVAVQDVDFRVSEGDLVGLIGPNGAGKTTVFNLISGVYTPTAGSVFFGGTNLEGQKPSALAGLGIARTFQNIRLFRSLTVLENVCVACNLHQRGGLLDALWRGRRFRKEEERYRQKASELLEIFGLESEADLPCESLSYGDQRRLEIVRAVATEPRLLLLDEPAAGMNATEKLELMRLIRFMQERFKLAVLLVEHDMKVVMGICQRVAVLEYGRKIAEGTPDQIQANPQVIAAYLGEEIERDA